MTASEWKSTPLVAQGNVVAVGHVLDGLLLDDLVVHVDPVPVLVRVEGTLSGTDAARPPGHGPAALLLVAGDVAGRVAGEHAGDAVGNVVVDHLGALRVNGPSDLVVLVGLESALKGGIKSVI